MSTSLPCAQAYIDGERRSGTRRAEVCNPARLSSPAGHVELGSTAMVDAAIEAAARAFPHWAALSVAARSEMLLAACARMEKFQQQRPDLAEILTREQGKIRKESAQDVAMAAQMIRLTLAAGASALEEIVRVDERGSHVTAFDPLGVVAVVTPWNWPVILSVLRMAPALIAGNTAVLKPAPNTPLAVTEVVAALASALPPGVVNIVHGGADVGAHLVSHPKVRAVTFTGSAASGRKVYAAGAATMKRIALELGGNDPAILLGDVRVTDALIRSIVASTFVTTGQVCVAIKRLYVHEDVFAEFLDKFVDAVDGLVVGDGLSPDVTMGPLNNAMQFDKVGRLLDEASGSGATVRTVGKRDAGVDWQDGFFMLPSVVTDVREDIALVRDEQFGPVIPVMPFSDVDGLVERANDTEYGLCASVWSSDDGHAFDVARRIEAGTVWINQHGLSGRDFGIATEAAKQSGIGLSLGAEGIQAFTNRRGMTNRKPA